MISDTDEIHAATNLLAAAPVGSAECRQAK